MEEEKREKPVPVEKEAPPSIKEYTVEATEPGGPGEGRPTPSPKPTEEDKK